MFGAGEQFIKNLALIDFFFFSVYLVCVHAVKLIATLQAERFYLFISNWFQFFIFLVGLELGCMLMLNTFISQ